MAAPRLAHNVFFKLKDNSPAKVQALVEACKKYLNVQPGIVFFAAGTLCADLLATSTTATGTSACTSFSWTRPPTTPTRTTRRTTSSSRKTRGTGRRCACLTRWCRMFSMMNRITPNDLPGFLRQYRLTGGRVRRVRVLYPRPRETAVEFHLSILEAIKNLGSEPRRVQLVLRVEGVEEFRFQMRPNQPKSKIADARIAYLNGLFFVNLDAWGLEPGEQPKLHEFRPARSMSAAGICTGKNGRAECRLQCRDERHHRTLRHRPAPRQAARLRRARPAVAGRQHRQGSGLAEPRPPARSSTSTRPTASARCLAEVGATAEVVAVRRPLGLAAKFNTVIFPASAHADRELKIDVVEQGYHVLKPGGLFLSLSEYEKDNQFAKWQKKVFGKCGETPSSENGMAFFSTKTDDSSSAAGTRSRSTRRSATARRWSSCRGRARSATAGSTTARGRCSKWRRSAKATTSSIWAAATGRSGASRRAKAGPTGRVTFIDSSLRALALAEMNAKANNVANARFVAATRLEGLEQTRST